MFFFYFQIDRRSIMCVFIINKLTAKQPDFYRPIQGRAQNCRETFRFFQSIPMFLPTSRLIAALYSLKWHLSLMSIHPAL